MKEQTDPTKRRRRQPRATFIAGLMEAGWSRGKASEAWQLVTGERVSLKNGAAPRGDDEPMNYAEAARFIGVAEGTLRRWVSSGLHSVPHLKYGRGAGPGAAPVKFLPSAMLRWMQSFERNGMPQTSPAAGADARA